MILRVDWKRRSNLGRIRSIAKSQRELNDQVKRKTQTSNNYLSTRSFENPRMHHATVVRRGTPMDSTYDRRHGNSLSRHKPLIRGNPASKPANREGVV